MANLREIKTKIKSVGNLKKITKALEIVSTVKLQKLKGQADALKNYIVDLMTIVSTVGAVHPIFQQGSTQHGEKSLVVVLTSERGLCGGLNSKLFRTISRDMKDTHAVDYFVVGKKGLEYFKRIGASIVGSLNVGDSFTEGELLPLFTYFDQALASGEYAEVKLYFNYFKNSIVQIPTSVELYPFKKASLEHFLSDVGVELQAPELGQKDLIIEPDVETFMVELRRQIRNYIISSALIQNKTGEHAARMIAMKNAKDNATEFSKKLKLNFNKARQGAITQEISEIVSAKIAIE